MKFILFLLLTFTSLFCYGTENELGISTEGHTAKLETLIEKLGKERKNHARLRAMPHPEFHVYFPGSKIMQQNGSNFLVLHPARGMHNNLIESNNRIYELTKQIDEVNETIKVEK